MSIENRSAEGIVKDAIKTVSKDLDRVRDRVKKFLKDRELVVAEGQSYDRKIKTIDAVKTFLNDRINKFTKNGEYTNNGRIKFRKEQVKLAEDILENLRTSRVKVRVVNG